GDREHQRHRQLERHVALTLQERGAAREGLRDLADVDHQEEQRDKQRRDRGLRVADDLSNRAAAQQRDLRHRVTSSWVWVCPACPSKRRPVAFRNTSSSEGLETEIAPTWMRSRSRRRTISAIELAPSSTYSANASASLTTRSRPVRPASAAS